MRNISEKGIQEESFSHAIYKIHTSSLLISKVMNAEANIDAHSQ